MNLDTRNVVRCQWAAGTPLIIDYHDREWGVPEHDDRKLFELLILEGAQAGLSWMTILKKREGYRKAFHDFDATKMATYGEEKTEELLGNSEIVRNRLKVKAAIQNARAFLAVRREFGSFDAYIWRFVNGYQKKNAITSLEDIPARTAESDAMSKDLIGRGFKFVGPTICYAYMQAVGLVNDHTVDCFRHDQV